ncbi:molybdopterin synthase catalytic subunit MoaE [Cellvibrio polysaccharolyticus]|uniref:Molybdopterin synthase catalytic subunit n=1 Tax=Cellvibrio polysaccharolyticus TaxID=2082724 RepID=A0A928V821_9GAMM|nr:molybdopterin synthase catalytic subunit MoaE [Cellvibrio polysaccharolyticus]MBE8718596.1 molybdopterin synthase catalytic subunit MoaE [Cellvibrio polysaccharolyticus]
MIAIQQTDFDTGAEYQRLVKAAPNAGGIVLFIGRVREFSEQQTVSALFIEHYPGMTERVFSEIAEEARQRWPLLAVTIIHRVGTLQAGDNIVLVGVASEHRAAAFEAAQYIMDLLKSRATLWKKEIQPDAENWVTAKNSDHTAAERWQKK